MAGARRHAGDRVGRRARDVLHQRAERPDEHVPTNQIWAHDGHLLRRVRVGELVEPGLPLDICARRSVGLRGLNGPLRGRRLARQAVVCGDSNREQPDRARDPVDAPNSQRAGESIQR